MFKYLKQRWQVNNIQLALIIFIFAAGGSLCGIAGRKLLAVTGIDKGFLGVLAYIILVIILWPVCILLISIPLGQFSFFLNYLIKIRNRIASKNIVIPVAIFASGAGSNAEKIINQEKIARKKGTGSYRIDMIVCNKPGAGVLGIAARHSIKTLLIEKERFFNSADYVNELKKRGIQFIVLAGFLWKLPVSLIRAYPNRIINIHPALLPKYGGKGMYGNRVHDAVIAAGEKESGITIHYVDEWYDHGSIIFQAKCFVDKNDTAETLAKKIHSLEHQYYPEVIGKLLKNAK